MPSSGQLLLGILCVLAQHSFPFVTAQITGPWSLNFNNTKGVGPDGPWRVISLGVGFPTQYADVYPGGKGATVVVSEDACEGQNLTCPSPQPILYNPDYVRDRRIDGQESGDITPRQWDQERAQALNLTGSASYRSERIFLVDGQNAYTTNNTVVLVSSNYTLQYPSGSRVPMSVGLLGMDAPVNPLEVSLRNGSTARYQTLVDSLASNRIIHSRSWALHIGSVQHNISGSLVFGGYDQSRVLGNIARFNSETARIRAITSNINFRDAASVVPSPTTPEDPLISPAIGPQNSHLKQPIEVHLDASVPYMYLPTEVCESMVSNLPVSFDTGLGLYLWNTSDFSRYQSYINSTSRISFIFDDPGNLNVTVQVPLALLNLTLEPPLVAQPTPYFPCRPIPAGDRQPARLGRAFLQAAFMARNWDSGELFVAQAPGPEHRGPSIRPINGLENTRQPSEDSPSWESTWLPVLGPLPQRVPGSESGLISRPNPSFSKARRRRRVSIGVGVGVTLGFFLTLAVLGVVGYRRRLRRRSQMQSQPQQYELERQKILETSSRIS
ncbi:MAG: hypothetical protein M1823_002233 [Watsoniomyces obsoletus]|nr:MAG: hypothetical protein M1823_002233 [Watsoniomyces obsoletus]